VGFTNDVTVAVWIGYDNADGKRRTLGGGSTGGHVAVPIFERVIQAAWAYAPPKAVLAPPSPEAKRQLACQLIDLEPSELQSGRGKAFSECFRVDRKGKVIDTEYRLMSQEGINARRGAPGAPAPSFDNPWSRDPWRAQQQWGWQWGTGQQPGGERREWRAPQPTWGSW
jgi:penicillin-binding protein 1A